MSETERLAAAIKTISETYLGRVVKSGDKDGIVKWSIRLADYSTRVAILNSPALAKAERVALEPFDAPPIDPGYFVDPGEGGDEVYIAGLEGGLPGEGVDWTLNAAIEWFKHVWTHGVGYHSVAPGLLPGSYCLTPEGLEFARAFQARTDLTEAPRDFNPLGLPVKR